MRNLKFHSTTGNRKSGVLPVRLFLGIALGASLGALGLAGCHSNPANTTNPADGTTASTDPNATDPTAANMAPVDNSTQVAGIQQEGQPTQQAYSNPAPAAAPIVRRKASTSQGSSGQSYSDPSYNQGYNDDQGYSGDQGYSDNQDYNAEQGYNATLSDIEAQQPPPPLPEYSQPVAPDPNYLWTPGYWSYAPQGYYWVPGAWVQAPYTGALWTPGYWGDYGQNRYRFHHGFWAAHIGFYGGINYGFGYVGTGYQGGYWNGNNFYYNQYANHIDENRIHNVYQRNVVVNNTVINNRVVNNTTYSNTTINNTRINNVSYNGGRGGVEVRPRPAELAVLREQRIPPMKAQVQQRTVAAASPQQFYARNQGRPAEAVFARPLVADHGIVAPVHTTAQINRAVPVQEQLRQNQQVFRPQAPQARPVAAPAAAAQPSRPALNQPQLQRPVPQNSAQPVRPSQPENRPGQVQTRPMPQPQTRPQPQQARPEAQQVKPQPQVRPQPQQVRPEPQQAKPQPQVRPQPQQARPEPQQIKPQPQIRPQPQQVRPESQQVRPQPTARPEPPQAKPEARPAPQPQARPQPQAERPAPQVQSRPQPQQQVRPQPQPQVRPQPQQQARPQARPEPQKPEPHNR